jgi:tRNA threonylcarbamoyladenosine biosynthesis protein TsaE
MTTRGVEQTREIGAILGELAEAGDVVLMRGELGVGKTCLAQGIARGLCIDEYVTSPTFVLLREYQGRLPLYHIDFYRLQRIEEVADMGLDDYLYGRGVCVVEWPERGFGLLPGEHLLVEMQYVASAKRKLSFAPRGPRYVKMLSEMREAASNCRVAGK